MNTAGSTFYDKTRGVRRLEQSAWILLENDDLTSSVIVLAVGLRRLERLLEQAQQENDETRLFLSALVKNRLTGLSDDIGWSGDVLSRVANEDVVVDPAEHEARLARFRSNLRILRGEMSRLFAPPKFLGPELMKTIRRSAIGLGAVVAAVLLIRGIRGIWYWNNGLLGEYYATADFTSTPIDRRDPTLDFRWNDGAPMSQFPADHFSIRWHTVLDVPESGVYAFTTAADDGVRLWIDDKQIIDDWALHTESEKTASAWLEKGRHPIRVDYFENEGDASIHLSWQPPGATSKKIIPRSRLFLPK